MAVSVFNENATCPKCGDAVIVTHFMSSRDDSYLGACRLNREYESYCPVGEHLHRRCQRCGFSWPERCVPEVNAEA